MHTGNPFIDALAGTSFLLQGGDNVFTYYFAPASSTNIAWSLSEEETFGSAVQQWANVADITFHEVTQINQADAVETLFTRAQWPDDGNTLAHHQYPSSHPEQGHFSTIDAWTGAGL